MAAQTMTLNVHIRWAWLLAAFCLIGLPRVGAWLCVKVRPE